MRAFFLPLLFSIAFATGCVLDFSVRPITTDDVAPGTDTDNQYNNDNYDDNGDDNENDTNSQTYLDYDEDTQISTESPENSITYCDEAAEKDLVVLECGPDGRIDSIDFAIFGEYTGSCKGPTPIEGQCSFAETVSVIESKCLGNSSCQFIADKKQVFGDVCKKDKHRFIVEYTCNYLQGCSASSLKTVPGKCGCNKLDLDLDGDGSADCNDECDHDPLKTAPGLCGCGTEDKDQDKDGTLSCFEECDNDPLKTAPGICGCGRPDIDIDDRDGDGTIDCKDDCPDDFHKTSPGICGCGQVDDPTDRDRDGTADCADGCPNDPHKNQVGRCGCGKAEIICGYCLDTPGYKDPQGYPCEEWDADCDDYLKWDYTASEAAEIYLYCPASCGLCSSAPKAF